MRRIFLGARRLLAASALLLASSLEICGCNPVTDCDRVRDLDIISTSWPVLLERCSRCLNSAELAALERNRERETASPSTGQRITVAVTVHQALQAGDTISFDDLAVDAPVDAAPAEPRSSLRAAEPSPWPIPESVFFVYKSVPSRTGGFRRIPSATAFVLSVPDVRHHSLVRFLVLARHIVDPQWAHCPEENPSSIEVRLNRRTGGVGFETIPLEVNHVRHFATPADGTSDIAVVQLDEGLIPHLETYKFMDTPFRLLPTVSELRELGLNQESPDYGSFNHPHASRPTDTIVDSRLTPSGAAVPGHPIITASLRPEAPPELNGYPVSNSGIFSDISPQDVEIRCGSASTPESKPKELRVWFIDAAVSHGVSGAPVYTSIVRDGETAQTPVLLGVQAVAWPERGEAGITPSTDLGELIQSQLKRNAKQMDFYQGALH